MTATLGWDIGGVHTKVARVEDGSLTARALPFAIERNPADLPQLLRTLAAAVGHRSGDSHGVTMTAELSQAFRTKREGVHTVLDAVAAAFPGACVSVFTTDGCFVAPADARAAPLAAAAANWAASAWFVARSWPDTVFIDVGSTTTDIIPIVEGTVRALGRTDVERLHTGELVYTGAVRTPAEALIPGLAAEGFALSGDAHVWRGRLSPEAYSVRTPDGRPASREFAGERLARVVCADREMLDDAAIDEIAERLWEAQLGRIVGALDRVLSRSPSLAGGIAITAGLGSFLAEAACRRAGLRSVPLAARFGPPSTHAPAMAVAFLLAATLARAESTP